MREFWGIRLIYFSMNYGVSGPGYLFEIRGNQKPSGGNTSLYRVTRQCFIVAMLSTTKKIRMIRDKLSRIGIGEKKLDDAEILASYSINQCGPLCPGPRTP